MTRANHWLLVLAGAAMVASIACGSSSTSTSSTAPGSLGTVEITDLQLTWSPAEAPSASDLDELSSYLRSRSMHTLLPSIAPMAGRSSVKLAAYSYPASNEIRLVLTVRINENASPLLSLSSYSKLPNSDVTGQSVTIRDVQGVVKVVPYAVSFLQWQERGQTFVAEFTTTDYEQMLLWLNQWRTVP